jgi:hypothetical protein
VPFLYFKIEHFFAILITVSAIYATFNAPFTPRYPRQSTGGVIHESIRMSKAGSESNHGLESIGESILDLLSYILPVCHECHTRKAGHNDPTVELCDVACMGQG